MEQDVEMPETLAVWAVCLEIQRSDGKWASLNLASCLRESLKPTLRQAPAVRLVLYGQLSEPSSVPHRGTPEQEPSTISDARAPTSELSVTHMPVTRT